MSRRSLFEFVINTTFFILFNIPSLISQQSSFLNILVVIYKAPWGTFKSNLKKLKKKIDCRKWNFLALRLKKMLYFLKRNCCYISENDPPLPPTTTTTTTTKKSSILGENFPSSKKLKKLPRKTFLCFEKWNFKAQD